MACENLDFEQFSQSETATGTFSGPPPVLAGGEVVIVAIYPERRNLVVGPERSVASVHADQLAAHSVSPPIPGSAMADLEAGAAFSGLLQRVARVDRTRRE